MLATAEEQETRWVEHFEETLNQPDPETTYNFDNEIHLPKLNVNVDVITEEETSSAISKMKNKAAGLDEITAEFMKVGGQTIISTLTILLNTCWTSEMVPDKWSKGIIVKLPKTGNLTDCNNWRGIGLLSIPAKILSTILLNRLRSAVDVTLREEQAGFRAGRSCTEQILTLKNIPDQCIEFQKPIVINFNDFKKAFDSVHRESLWKIVKIYGIPEQFIDTFKAIYLNSRCCIKTETGMSIFFLIKTGVRQGYILSTLLFLMVIDFLLSKAVDTVNKSIRWKEENKLAELYFADDTALTADSIEDLKIITTNLEKAAAKVGIKISQDKT